jgi:hypothetical protein
MIKQAKEEEDNGTPCSIKIIGLRTDRRASLAFFRGTVLLSIALCTAVISNQLQLFFTVNHVQESINNGHAA